MGTLVKVKQSTIPGEGKGLFDSCYFKKDESVTIFMGIDMVTTEEMIMNHHSNYAMNDIEPCNLRDEMHQYYFLAQMIYYGNYTVEDICFDEIN